ncbi:MAG: hypothetical protein BMS9Abin10_0577 [Gammaproteobacteria bacterium]|nr:MAG: hypothetical protein BMS9Abin10_0577 [Gammaproteobacteria bacterium]
MKKYALFALVVIVHVPNTASTQHASSRPAPAFGSSADVNYAKTLWKALRKTRLVGESSIGSTPYKGTHPHGTILETLDGVIKVTGDKGEVIVKKNYGGPGTSKTNVADNPKKYLKSITVMFRRPNGYDPDNKDWFWVKYAPNGLILNNPAGKPLAGRVAKGVRGKGCIDCHKTAPGGDYVFNHDRYAR